MNSAKKTSSKQKAARRPRKEGELEPGISLNEVHRRLVRDYQDRAPARITLHRHSASGALDHLVVRTTGARRYYNTARILAYYRTSLARAEFIPAKASAQLPQEGQHIQRQTRPAESGQGGAHHPVPMQLLADPQSSATIVQAILDTVLPAIRVAQEAALKEAAQQAAEVIRTEMAPLEELLTKINAQLSDLSKTRQSLMLKYDSVANLTAQQLASAQEEVKRLRRADDTTLGFTRLQVEIRRIQETLQALVSRG